MSTPVPIARGYLLSHLLLSLGTTSNWRICSSVRLVGFKAYMPGGTTVWNGTSTTTVSPTVAVTWASANSPSETITESNGGSTMMIARFPPPKDSLAAFWSSTGVSESEALFYIQSSVGVILDVTMELVITSNVEIPATIGTTSSGTAGKVYQTYLDGPMTGAVIAPLGTPSLN